MGSNLSSGRYYQVAVANHVCSHYRCKSALSSFRGHVPIAPPTERFYGG